MKFVIGIDVSRLTLDIALLKTADETCTSFTIVNSEEGLLQFFRTAYIEFKVTRRNSLVCAEQMGIFNTYLQQVCVNKKLNLCLESPLHIKRSLGIQRGKSDSIDAIRIARYAYRQTATLKLWQPPRPEIIQVKELAAIRRKLLKMKGMCTSTQTNAGYYQSSFEEDLHNTYTQNIITSINKEVGKIEEAMEDIFVRDERLATLRKIVTSVPYIGKVISTQLIISTNEFEEHWTANKFASYCGIAPYSFSSGTSVKGKTKVSNIANKEVKALVHIAALGNSRMKDSFLEAYYKRKLAEGKNKMSVLNAIRNKVIARVFSCVRAGSVYREPLPIKNN